MTQVSDIARVTARSPDGRTLAMWQTRFPLGDAPLALG